jgi:cytochrome P450
VYPIYRIHDGKSLPTCPYRFPDGQGDVPKFLDGERNSEEWGKEHGRVYRVWSGTVPEIVLTKPEDVKQVFRDSNTHLKASNSGAGWLMGELLGRCLGLVSGDEWQAIRSATAASFTKYEVVERVAQMERLTEDHFEALHQRGRLNQGVIDPIEDLRMLPFWIVADQLYGALDPVTKKELEDLIPLREALFARVIQGGATRFSWSKFLPTKINKDLKNFRRRWHKLNDTLVHRAKDSPLPQAPIVEMYRTVQEGRISPESLYQTLDEMLFANLDVTTGAISWNLMFLAANSGTQDGIRDEIKQARTSGKTKLGNNTSQAPLLS